MKTNRDRAAQLRAIAADLEDHHMPALDRVIADLLNMADDFWPESNDDDEGGGTVARSTERPRGREGRT